MYLLSFYGFLLAYIKSATFAGNHIMIEGVLLRCTLFSSCCSMLAQCMHYKVVCTSRIERECAAWAIFALKMHRLAHRTISKMDWKCAMNGEIKCSAGWIAVEIEVCSITADGSTFDYGPRQNDQPTHGCPHQRSVNAFALLLLLLRRFFPCIQQFADIKLIARSAVRTQLIARPFC